MAANLGALTVTVVVVVAKMVATVEVATKAVALPTQVEVAKAMLKVSTPNSQLGHNTHGRSWRHHTCMRRSVCRCGKGSQQLDHVHCRSYLSILATPAGMLAGQVALAASLAAMVRVGLGSVAGRAAATAGQEPCKHRAVSYRCCSEQSTSLVGEAKRCTCSLCSDPADESRAIRGWPRYQRWK